MSNVNELLDKVREATNLPSDNALAQRMTITRAVISAWRSDRNPIPDERIAQLCAMAKLDGAEWMARVHAERAQSREERALWKSMLDRLSAAAAVVALIVLPMGVVKAENAVDSTGYQASAAHSLYITYNSPGRT